MKLSIIIPVYNTKEYLEECVASLFEQNIPQNSFEIILINDGSTDGSLETCRFLANKCKNIRVINQENRGQSAARNEGLKAAKGKYIYFIDSDDYLKSGYLNRFLHISEKNGLDFVGFKTYNTSKKRISSLETDPPLILSTEGNGLQIITEHDYYNGSCWYIFKKELAENLFFEEGRVCEDIIFTTLLLLRVKNGRVYDNEVYAYYTNSESTVRTKNIERLKKITDDMFHVTKRFSEIIKEIDFRKNSKAFFRLKKRQESYTYFAIIRFIRSQRSFSELIKTLEELEKLEHPAYPINNFKGYNKRDKLLIKCFNNRVLFLFLFRINQLLNIIK